MSGSTKIQLALAELKRDWIKQMQRRVLDIRDGVVTATDVYQELYEDEIKLSKLIKKCNRELRKSDEKLPPPF